MQHIRRPKPPQSQFENFSRDTVPLRSFCIWIRGLHVRIPLLVQLPYCWPRNLQHTFTQLQASYSRAHLCSATSMLCSYSMWGPWSEGCVFESPCCGSPSISSVAHYQTSPCNEPPYLHNNQPSQLYSDLNMTLCQFTLKAKTALF